LKTHLINDQQWLIRMSIQVTVFAGNIGMRNYRVNTGQFSGPGDIKFPDSRTRMLAVQKFAG
jgi:hypothetical protein